MLIKSAIESFNREPTLELSLFKELFQENKNNIIQDNVVTYDEPLIRLVNHLIESALQQLASDIHIEPFEKHCRIRYRQDGLLYEMAQIPISLATRLATRFKVMANLDISERRLPQDGRFQFKNNDLRLNICPTLFGEKIVLRILDNNKIKLEINELGFTDAQKTIFNKKISEPQGLILVTGPTGSGKTVTLYTALTLLNSKEKNISTIEDPVEIQLPGVNQVNVNPKIGLHFSNVLRSFLRQDPDVIMLGEIRDTESAEIAIQAAQTGHLVLSTLHTNSALETLIRLLSMGIPAYNLINAVTLIIAQRLIRKLCIHCKKIDSLTSAYPFPIYRAEGCKLCLQGYLGRAGIYEFLPINDSIADLILSKANINVLKNVATSSGFLSLYENGLEIVKKGITSLAEINRVIPK